LDLSFDQWTPEEIATFDQLNPGQKAEFLIQRAENLERERCARLAEAADQGELAAVIRSGREQ
jgi:hypothetical protein